MIKLVFMLKRKDGMTPAAFRAHYEDSHVPLALNHFGHLLTEYRRNYPQSALLNPSGQSDNPPPIDPPYDAVAEMWVEDESKLEELGGILNDPELSPLFAADKLLFLERDQTLMLVCDEVNTGTKP